MTENVEFKRHYRLAHGLRGVEFKEHYVDLDNKEWYIRNVNPAGFENAIKGLEELQAELVPSAKNAVSDNFTIADSAVAPFLLRLDLLSSNDVGVYEGENTKLYQVLNTKPKFERLWNYILALKERPNVNATFPAVADF
ncbi:hypothetical protein M422DRAFT_66024 [Sphaerobolus stellatus SS14]|nr:hypothetical protein M422DRAFT_66024 [Sphaerobolus stellatus SS14]